MTANRALSLQPSTRRGGPCVRPGQPVTQQTRRFRRRAGIKRHQRGRNAGHADDVSAPAVVSDWGDLNQIRAARYGFFEALDGCLHVFVSTKFCRGVAEILRFAWTQTSEATDEGSCTVPRSAVFPDIALENILTCRYFNRKCTVRPQDLHSRTVLCDLDPHYVAHYA